MTNTTSLPLSNEPIQGEIGITVRDEDVVFVIKRHPFDIAPTTFALPFLQLDMIFQQRLSRSITTRAQLQGLSLSAEKPV